MRRATNTRLHWFWRDDAGGTAVEMALVVTIFLTFLLGGANYGLYLWTANGLQQTAIQTARCMGVLRTDCSASRIYSASATKTFARNVAAGYGITLTASQLTLNAAAACGGQGSNNASVTVSYTYTGLSGQLVPGGPPSAMSATACFPNQT